MISRKPWVTVATAQEQVISMCKCDARKKAECKMKRESISERADRMRLEILKLSDDELFNASNEIYGDTLLELPDFIVDMSNKNKKSMPF